VKEDNEEEEKN